ncbi:1577_t:CDS:2 [Paraglomus occultum]|uniref:1577_t:CDS:1 n=1 Tax=Paraglomus occultum TaxID=144539 RepID=A0A9N9CGA8_9GLOM|nr:1577_t:CDS:2 [Paraglomus occultum]
MAMPMKQAWICQAMDMLCQALGRGNQLIYGYDNRYVLLVPPSMIWQRVKEVISEDDDVREERRAEFLLAED